MKIWRIILNGFLLTLLNIMAILFGYGVYNLIKPANQIIFQASVAAFVNIAVYLLCAVAVYQIPVNNLILKKKGEFFGIYLLAFIWIPALFVPLHFLTQGYLTSFGNIMSIWLFQIPTNLVAILAGHYLIQLIRKSSGFNHNLI